MDNVNMLDRQKPNLFIINGIRRQISTQPYTAANMTGVQAIQSSRISGS